MTEYTIYNADTAPKDSAPILKKANEAYGFIPNLLGTMAEAPALLEGYVTLAGIFDKTSFSATERQIVMITNNLLNDCTYCMAAHTVLSKMAGVPDDVVNSLRENTPIADSKLEALRQFTIVVNKTRGWPQEDDVNAFLSAGYTKQNILEVILGTSLKIMSNYTNHIAETDLDDAFKPAAWTKDSLKSAA
jgi:AhpD family alkylhydroperoxidase